MLMNEKTKLIDDLRQAVLNGDAGAVAVLQNKIASLSPQIIGAKAAELKSGIEGANQRLDEIAIETKVLEEERAERNKRLAAAILEQERCAFAVQKVDLALGACDAEAENLRDFKRQAKRELAELSDSITKTFIGE